jgi:hypothetical protein
LPVDQQRFGAVIGLPTICGIPRATNGIEVALERSDGEVVLGHLAWFEKDKAEHSASRKATKAKESKTTLDMFL